MCAANATVVNDSADNKKFAKSKASGRIDGMVALAMAIGMMPNHNQDDDGDFSSFIADPIGV
jgi:phage terminase large subunit-like protein